MFNLTKDLTLVDVAANLTPELILTFTYLHPIVFLIGINYQNMTCY